MKNKLKNKLSDTISIESISKLTDDLIKSFNKEEIKESMDYIKSNLNMSLFEEMLDSMAGNVQENKETHEETANTSIQCKFGKLPDHFGGTEIKNQSDFIAYISARGDVLLVDGKLHAVDKDYTGALTIISTVPDKPGTSHILFKEDVMVFSTDDVSHPISRIINTMIELEEIIQPMTIIDITNFMQHKINKYIVNVLDITGNRAVVDINSKIFIIEVKDNTIVMRSVYGEIYEEFDATYENLLDLLDNLNN